MRTGDIGKALKLLEHGIFRHMNDMVDDQFDFHQYCLRRMTLRAYVAMLRNTDRIWDNKFYRRAAYDLIDCYVKLSDERDRSRSMEGEEGVDNGNGGGLDQVDLTGLSAKERKKLREKQKKAAKREAEAEAKISGPVTVLNSPGLKADDDPLGHRLASVDDPLGEAERHVNLLQEHSAHVLMSNLKAFEVYIRRGKLLLALRCIKRAGKVSGKSMTPEIFRMTVRLFFVHFLTQNGTSNDIVQSVLESERQKFTEGKSFSAFASDFRKEYPTIAGDLAYYEMLHMVNKTEQAHVASGLLSAATAHLGKGSATGDLLHHLIKVHKALTEMRCESHELGHFSKNCAELFPHSRYFQGSKCCSADAAYDALCAWEAS